MGSHGPMLHRKQTFQACGKGCSGLFSRVLCALGARMKVEGFAAHCRSTTWVIAYSFVQHPLAFLFSDLTEGMFSFAAGVALRSLSLARGGLARSRLTACHSGGNKKRVYPWSLVSGGCGQTNVLT